ncbi:MAG: DUF4215 domain-containing protein [Myxococcota bacterium]
MKRLLALLGVLLAPSAAYADYFVGSDTTGDGNIDTCTAFAAGSLQAAVDNYESSLADWLLVEGPNIESAEVSVSPTPPNTFLEVRMQPDNGICGSGLLGGSISRAASPSGRLFNVDDATLTLVNLGISGGDDTNGGTILVNDGALRLRRTTVSGGSADVDGGCIHSTNSTVTMSGDPPSEVRDCTATEDGGGLYFDGGSGTLQLVTNNDANRDGGGVYAVNGANVLAISTISENSAEEHGGGVRVSDATFTLEASTISENYAELNGGGIHADSNSTIDVIPKVAYEARDGCDGVSTAVALIQGNGAGFDDGGNEVPGNLQDGGGIFLDQSTLFVDGIWTPSPVTRNPAGIRLNQATQNGGGIAATNGSKVTTKVTDIAQNDALYGDGGGVYVDASLAQYDIVDPRGLYGTWIDRNGAAGDGGGMRVTGPASTAGIYYQVFVASEYQAYWDTNWFPDDEPMCPGHMFPPTAPGQDEKSFLGMPENVGPPRISNIADQHGGGAAVDGGASLELGADTRKNLANAVYDGSGTGQGGGIHVDLGVLDVELNDPRHLPPIGNPNHLDELAISGNAAHDGGGLWLDDTTVDLPDDLKIRENRVNGEGGGAYVAVDAVVTSSADFTSNGSAPDNPGTPEDEEIQTQRGGGMAVVGGDVAVESESHWLTNKATLGGGLSVTGSTALVTFGADTYVQQNRAEDLVGMADGHGGGAYVDGAGTLELDGNAGFSFNVATDDGGGIAVDGGTATVYDATLQENEADLGGGAHITSGTLTMREATLQANEARTSGGGLYAGGGTVAIGDGDPNTAVCSTGGPCVKFDGNLAVDNKTTPTAGHGGGITVAGSVDLDLVRVLLSENEAVSDGAALYLTDPGADADLFNVAIVSNGGFDVLTNVPAVQVDDGDLTCNYCTSGHNDHAFEFAGANGSTLELFGSVVADHAPAAEFLGTGTITGDCIVVETTTAQTAFGGTDVAVDAGIDVDHLTGRPDEDAGTIGELVYQCATGPDVDIEGQDRPTAALTDRDRGAYELDCGDGVKQAWEECDDGNDVDEDECLNTCVDWSCGDSVVRTGVEECDDGNAVGGDGCSATCQLEVCGNNVVDVGEECDDGNTTSGDGCSDICEIEAGCGDGNVDPGEDCDDGNTSDGDGCSSTCTLEGVIGINGNYCQYNTLDAAVMAASANDVIHVGADLSGAAGSISVSMPNNLTVQSATDDCTQYNAVPRGLLLLGNTFVATGTLDFTARSLDVFGGGANTVTSTGGVLILDALNVDGGAGDAVVVTDTDLDILLSQINNNLGVGVVVDEVSGTSTATITDTKLDGNDQAVVVDAGTVTLEDSEVYNQVSAPAVTATDSAATLTVRRTRLQNNAGAAAFTGSAAHASGGGDVHLINALVTGHPAGGPAIGAEDAGSLMDVLHGTITDNGFRGMEVTAGADLVITNSIDGGNGAASRTAAGTTLTADCVNMTPPVGGGTKSSTAPILNANALFNTDYTLDPASPSVDQCTTGTRPDLAGDPVNGDYDQGCFEVQ